MKSITTLLFLVMYCLSSAQETNTISLSLKEAIDLGLKNSSEIKSQEINTTISNNNVSIQNNNWLPELTVKGSVRYNTQLQQNILPPGFGGGTGQESIAFGTKNRTSFSLDLEQNLINPNIKYNKKIEQQKGLIESEKLEDKKSNIAIDITEAYYNVILKAEQNSNAKNIEERQLAYFNIVKAEDELNQATTSNLLQAKINYKNAAYETTIAHLELKKAEQTLLTRLNLPLETALFLTDNVQSISVPNNELILESDSAERSEITQLKIQKEISALELSMVNRSLIPTVSFVANYTALYQSDYFDYSGDFWSPFNYVGVQASLPVSNLYKNKANKTKHQLTIEQYNYEITSEGNNVIEEINSTKADLEIARANMANTQETYELTTEIYSQTKKEFELGVLLYDQVLEKEKSMLNTQINYLNAVYNYLLAKLNYQVALGIY